VTALAYARLLTGATLAFHIVFATLGVGLPLFIAVAEAAGLARRDADLRLLARRWVRGFAILVVTGAASGTLIGLDLYIFWPRFMLVAGQVIILPFALEGMAFFVEAAFLAIYLYGSGGMRPWARWALWLPVVGGAGASALLVTTVNTFMNQPVGFRLAGLTVSDVRPWAAMFNPGTPVNCLHVLVTAYLATGLGLAAATQPAKFAAMEGLLVGRAAAPEVLFGWPSAAAGRIVGGITLPLRGLESWLAYGRASAFVRGLDAVPRADWPPLIVHDLFDLMVAVGFAALALVLVYGVGWWRRRAAYRPGRWLLAATVVMGALGLAAIECGWLVDEEGRQPWLLVGLMRLDQGVTTAPGVGVLAAIYLPTYLALLVLTAAVLRATFRRYPLRFDAAGHAREEGPAR
jgi:cytochrome d ubiquinol oxidase subunit I